MEDREEVKAENVPADVVPEQIEPEVLPAPTGPYLYGEALSAELTKLQEGSRGDEDALQELELTQEEAK